MATLSIESLVTRLTSLKIILGLLPVALLARFYAKWRQLRHVPGPFWWSITPLPNLMVNLKGTSHEAQDELIKRYGSLVRIGTDTVLTTDYNHCQKMAENKSRYTKGRWYSSFRFQAGISHLFAETDEATHNALRTKVGPGHAPTTLVEESMDRQLTRLFALVEKEFTNPRDTALTKRVDLTVLTHYFALDVIGDMTFGAPFGFLDEGIDLFGWIQWNDDFFPVASTCAVFPILGDLVQCWPFSLALPTSKDKVGLGRFIRAAEDSLDSRAQAGALPRKDMIAQFLKSGVTRTEATSAALVQIVAGTDSVAVAIRMTMLLVFSNPRIYAKLMDELINAEQTGAITRPLIREAEAKQLPYLQAVIREGLRKFPPLTPLLSKTVPEGGDIVCGYHLPAGTQVGVHIGGIMRSTEYWGDDADMFRPERWLEADEIRREEMLNCLEAAFGYGRYKCLGRGVAFMEMNKTLPEFFLRYNVTFTNPTKPLDVMYSAAFWMMHGLWASITPRV